jgi:DNA topoisomerase IB
MRQVLLVCQNLVDEEMMDRGAVQRRSVKENSKPMKPVRRGMVRATCVEFVYLMRVPNWMMVREQVQTFPSTSTAQRRMRMRRKPLKFRPYGWRRAGQEWESRLGWDGTRIFAISLYVRMMTMLFVLRLSVGEPLGQWCRILLSLRLSLAMHQLLSCSYLD